MIRLLFCFMLLPVAAIAQDRRPSHCIAIAEAPGVEYLQYAAFADPLDDYTVRLNYVDHSMFLIETQGGLRAVTDYNGFIGSTRLPDIVTMNGNSIFVFEVAGLCIGHLGHLHFEPSAEQYAALGRLDVVMAPVDGGLTVDLPTMIRVLQRLRSSVVIPMHWFSDYALGDFLEGRPSS